VAHLGHAHHLKGLDCLTNGRAADAEALSELSFRRETVAGPESAR